MGGLARLGVILVTLLSLIAMAGPAIGDEKSFGPPTVPDGFRIAPAIQGVHHPTRLVFGPDERLYIAQQTGEILAITLKDGSEVSRQQVAAATPKRNLLGIALKGDHLWVSETGVIARYQRQPDGSYAEREELVTAIPFGLHQNDGFAWGPDGKLYWGLGSTTDRGPEEHEWSGTIMRMDPDGQNAEVFARGFRNPYGLAFDPQGNLWATDNGADDPGTSDELNRVVEGGDYGYPRLFEHPPAGSGTRAPHALFGVHNSTNGILYYDQTQFPTKYQGGFFVAMWGSSFDDSIGRSVGFVKVDGEQAEVTTFATGFNRPLDITMGPTGDLWVADFFGQTVYRIWYERPASEPGAPSPAPPRETQAPPAPAPPAPASPAKASHSAWFLWLAGLAMVGLLAFGLVRARSGR